MTRPHFVPDTPSATYAIHGGCLSLSDLGLEPILPLSSEDTVYQDSSMNVVRLRLRTMNRKPPLDDLLRFTFKAEQNMLWLTAVQDQLHLYVGQALYRIVPSSKKQIIVLNTREGADTLYVADEIENPVVINSGPGNDYVCVGGQHTTLLTGKGDDTIKITSGISNLDAGDGDDSIQISSAATTRVYAGEGDDRVQAGSGLGFIDAGPGHDQITGGSGHNILSGGDGNDVITAGTGTHVIYPGQGHDLVSGLKPTDTVYSQANTTMVAITNAQRREWMLEKLNTLPLPSVEQVMAVLMPDDPNAIHHTPVAASDAGKIGVLIAGTPEFVTRVEADFTLLRLSPNGQKLLQALDTAAQRSGTAVRVEYFEMANASFAPSSTTVEPTILNDQPGTPAYGGVVQYNPNFSPSGLLPIIGLYHELCHAYNAVTGTVVPGETAETLGTKTVQTPNRERQAVGLPIAMEPFDFDLDPDTPPTRTNPEAFTENGIRKEFGLPMRSTYASNNKGD